METLVNDANHQLDLERKKKIQEEEAAKKKKRKEIQSCSRKKKCIKRMALELKLAKWGYFHWTFGEQQPSGLEWHIQVTCVLRCEFMALGAALSKTLPLPSQHLGRDSLPDLLQVMSNLRIAFNFYYSYFLKKFLNVCAMHMCAWMKVW